MVGHHTTDEEVSGSVFCLSEKFVRPSKLLKPLLFRRLGKKSYVIEKAYQFINGTALVALHARSLPFCVKRFTKNNIIFHG